MHTKKKIFAWVINVCLCVWISIQWYQQKFHNKHDFKVKMYFISAYLHRHLWVPHFFRFSHNSFDFSSGQRHHKAIIKTVKHHVCCFTAFSMLKSILICIQTNSYKKTTTTKSILYCWPIIRKPSAGILPYCFEYFCFVCSELFRLESLFIHKMS